MAKSPTKPSSPVRVSSIKGSDAGDAETLYCSFCGASQHDVKVLIAEKSRGAFICDDCIDLCEDTILGNTNRDAFLVRIRLPSGFNGGETILASAISDLVASQYPRWTSDIVQVSRNNVEGIDSYLKLLLRPPPSTSSKDRNTVSSAIDSISEEISVLTTKYLNEKSVREKIERELLTVKSDFFDYMREKATLIKVAKLRVLRAIMFLDIVGFSKLSEIEREDKLDFLRAVVRPLLRDKGASDVNMWGDGIIAAFEDEKIVVEVAASFLRHLAVEQAESRIGIAWGEVRVVHNDGIDRIDYDGEVVNRAARLEPLAEAGEIILSQEFRGIDFSRNKLLVNEKEVTLRKAFGDHLPGDIFPVLSVKPVGN
jgi:hypothetical protein